MERRSFASCVQHLAKAAKVCLESGNVALRYLAGHAPINYVTAIGAAGL